MKPILLAATLVVLSSPLSAEPLRLAQATTTNTETTPKAVAPKPKPSKPKAQSGTGAGAAGRSEGDYRKVLQAEPRRIRKEDLEDDPSAPSASRITPGINAQGRPTLGGRF